MKKIIMKILICAAMVLATNLSVSANVVEDYKFELEQLAKFAIENPLVIKNRTSLSKVNELSNKVVSKANKKINGNYVVQTDEGTLLTLVVFDVSSFVTGVLSFQYDIYLTNPNDFNEGILIYQDQVGTVDIVGKNAIFNFNVPAGNLNAFFSIATDKKGDGEEGLTVVTSNLNCPSSGSGNYNCTRSNSADNETQRFNFTIRKI